ncbi:hypothetical protein BDA96_03G341100 [Sorghum bicolor]|uniref:Uncharacterized protein n=2 Tax=Sorghum bicolor TaxID=4558 RepID=A0A921RJ09_SORBI|nr:hypothetical protein BDA96_03G341100 [Sorghum bicolor]OQU87666.1 hypothetical protein SORBI_3003G316350 [Sorghum bicolor]
MCHPGLPPLPPGCAVRRRERQAAVAPSPSPSAPRARQAQAAPHYYCVCSPTGHRGSFRCRLHRSGFEWGRRRPVANTPGRAEAGPAMHARMAAP